jgi:5-methylcytosine-specific restriction endonuclease McrA
MEENRPLQSIPDDELLRRLAELMGQSRRIEADILAHIAEVEERRLYAREAFPSMFAYCMDVLHLSEAEAYLRIWASRASRKHPMLLTMLADGRLHLTAITRLAPYLTPENRDGLLERATYRSKRQVLELIAEIAPRPDVPAVLRKLPERRALPTPPVLAVPSRGEVLAPRLQPMLGLCPDRVATPDPGAPRNDAVRDYELDTQRAPAVAVDASAPPAALLCASASLVSPPAVSPSAVWSPPVSSPPVSPHVSGAPAWASVVEPLSPGRYKVQFTASAEFHRKLERLRALTGSGAPDGDLAAVIEQAITEKLERLEARRFARTVGPRKHPVQAGTLRKGPPMTAAPHEHPAKTAAPRGASGETTMQTEPESSPTSRYIPAKVRRAVCERDGNRCRYVDEQGRRCPERNRLEFHHRRPFGLGGEHSVANIGLVCHAHNAYLADCDYGRESMASHRTARRLSSQVEAGPRE